MTQYREGQEIEVYEEYEGPLYQRRWCKAKIIAPRNWSTRMHPNAAETYEVQFPDGYRAVFDAAHIRAAFKKIGEAIEAAYPLGYRSEDNEP